MKRINITCPACGSRAYLRPASVVYGDKAPDPDAKYYVCGRYPACDCYVAAHRKTMLPMGTLADKALRKKRHDAHVALDSLWKNGVMSRKEAYRAKEARLREQTAAANGGGQLADALLCHVNYRITAMLRAAYPNARWEWLADKPSRFAVEGGTARIRVYGIPDFDYADVKLDQKANLDCSLVKLSPLVTGASDTQPPNRQPVNPRVWFETRGRAVLEALVTDLNSRGHSSLTVQENGEVFVQAKENEAEPAKETFLDFPEKVYWPQLVKVLEEEGYPNTPAIKVQLLPVNAGERITMTQNLGQPLSRYQAFLCDGMLEVDSTAFMDYMEENDLGYIVDYKRYNADVFTGVNCRTAAVFQFHSAALRRLNKVGCQRYEGDYTRLKQKHAERRARRMAG